MRLKRAGLSLFLAVTLAFAMVGCDRLTGSSDVGESTDASDTTTITTSTVSAVTTTVTTSTVSSATTSTAAATTPAATTQPPEYPPADSKPDFSTATQPPATTAPPAQTTAATQATTAATTPPVTTTAPPAAQQGSNGYSAVNYPEIKAVWLSYLEFQTMLQGKSEAQFRANLGAAYSNLVGIGINTVYVQCRAFGDAYYTSSLFPWADAVTGTYGAAPSFDPLTVMVDEGHARGLSVQAWINPLRGPNDKQMSATPDAYPIKQWYNDPGRRGTYINKVGDRWFLNPAYPEVRKLIADGAAEIVARYKVDGVHIDDYFYPTTDASFDAAAFSASGAATLSAWRLDNVSEVVRGLYNAVHGTNGSAVFSVSPQGNVNNDYNNQYADVRKWCSTSGYLDIIIPQIYYGFKNSTSPYEATLQQWNSMVTAPGVKLAVGLAAYKIGVEDTWAGAGKTEWQTDSDILSRQTAAAKTQSRYGGVVLFRYSSVFSSSAQMENERASLAQQLK